LTPYLVRLRERFLADPGDRVAFEALEEHHFLRAEWNELVPLYERYLAASESSRSPVERARLFYRLGQALEEGLADAERAAEYQRQALALDPGFAPALRRLRAHCAAAGRWEEALALAEREAEGLARPEERVLLLVEVGELCLGERGNAALAIQSFTRALEALPAQRRALVGLPQALEKAGRLQESVQAWERAIPRLEGSERAAAQRALGRLLAGPLGELERAFDLYEAAHRAEPQEPEWLEALATTLAALGRWEPAAALAERRIALARDAARRAAIALEAGRIHLDRLGDAPAARRWFERALEQREDGAGHLALAEAAGRLGSATDRSWHLERAMELGAEIPTWWDAGPPTQATGERGDPSTDRSDPAGDAHQAAADELARLRRAALERPDDPEASEALAAALAAGHHDVELAELLERRAALPGTGPSQRAALMLEVGEIREARLGDLDAAVESYQMAFAVQPSLPAAADALERVLRKLERFDELGEVLALAADAAPPPRRAALLCACGELVLARRGAADEALRRFEDALALEPRSTRALEGATRAAAAQGDRAALLSACQREAAACEPERLRVLVAEMARLPGGAEAALPAARRWLDAAPEDRDALEALARLLEELGHTEELVSVLERLDARLDGTERAANQRRLAWLHAAEGRGEPAIEAWRNALGHDPRDVASLEALLEALGEAGRDEEVLALLDAHALSAPSSPRSWAARRARSLERVGRSAEAVALYRTLLEDPAAEREPGVAEGLERAARGAGDDAALALALAERANAAFEPAARERLELELAGVLDERLDRSDEARALLTRLAGSADREIADAVERRLESMLERSGDWAALCDRLEARLDAAPRTQAWKLHARIAELAELRLGDPGRARRHLEIAVGHNPEQAELWRRLASLYDEDAQPEELLRALEGELASLAFRTDDAQTLPDQAAALHARAARIASHQLADAERAEPHWRRVNEIDPSHAEASEFLIDRLETTGRLEEVPRLLRARLAPLSSSADTERRSDLRLRLAAWLADRLGRPDEAIRELEAGYDEPDSSAALAAQLAELYARVGRMADLAVLCERSASASAPGRERGRWWLRAGDAWRESGNDAGAARAYELALAETPADEEPRAALRELLRRRGDAPALAALLEDDLARPGAPESRLRAELAELYDGPLADPARALEHLVRLATLDPRDAALRERAVARALAQARPETAVDLLRRAAADPRGGAQRVKLWARCAELLAGALAQPDASVDALRASLRLDAEQPELWHALRALLESLGRGDEALAALRGEWQTAASDDRVELAAHGADLALRSADPSALGAWLERLVAAVPDDAELWLRIAQIHAAGGRPAARERALAEAARHLRNDSPRCRDLHRERATVLERELAAPARAIGALEEARRLDPDHPELLSELDRLYTASSRPRELLDVLEARMARASGSTRRALERRAAACAESLGDAGRAAALWAAGLADDALAPEQRSALLPRAAAALRAARRLTEWTRIAEEELHAPSGRAGSPSPERRIELRRQLARAFQGPLARPERALPHLRALADGEPGGAPAATLAERAQLLDALRAERAGLELARRLAEWLRAQPDDLAVRGELARLYEERLGAPAAAAEAWRELLERAPARADSRSREALAGLRRTSERCRDWPELVRALQGEIATLAPEAGEPGRGIAIAERWRRIGRIRLDRLADAAGAEQAFAAARGADARDLAALRALEELAEARRDAPRALGLYREEIEQLGDTDPARRRALWLRSAELASEPAQAANAFERAHAFDPLDAPGLASWARALAELGDPLRWCTVFAAWCDSAEAAPSASDWLALARSLADLGRADEAAVRLERAFEREPNFPEAWELAARLREEANDPPGAASAWMRAGEAFASVPASAAAAGRAFARAAALLEAGEPARAAQCLELAVRAEPGCAPAQAALARVAERLGRADDAAAAAWRSLAPDAEPRLEGADRLAVALIGARSARAQGRWQAAWDMSSEALAIDPRAPDALGARGIAAFHLSAPAECRRALEARLALPDPDPESTLHLSVLARALESLNEFDGALSRYREALAIDPTLEEAQAGRLRVLERQGRREEAAAALAEWAQRTPGAGQRADRLVRAARLARLPDGDPSRVEAWLQAALDAEPSHATAWLELATWLWESGRGDDAFAAASDGVELVDSPSVRAVLETIRGRVLEARGDRDAALAAFLRAAECDPEAREAALAAAGLLRMRGEWREAAALLRRSAERRGPEDARADLFFELGRILAGPLEDVTGALDAYRRARELAPARAEVREAYAALLAQVPERRREAITELGGLLSGDPLRAEALRRLARIADQGGDSRGAARGLALLRALGVASPPESEQAPAALDFAIAADDSLGDETSDALRRALLAAAPALESAVAVLGSAPEVDPELQQIVRAWRAAGAELAGAGVLELGAEKLAATMRGLAGGDLAGKPRRQVARALRGIGQPELACFDFAEWRSSLRALALARAVDATGGDLRAALLAAIAASDAADGSLAVLPRPELRAQLDLRPWISGCAEARAVLERAVGAWIASLRP